MTQAQQTQQTQHFGLALPVAAAAAVAGVALSVAIAVTQGPITFERDAAPVTATRAEQAWQHQHLQISGATYASAPTAAEQAWQRQHLQISEATYGRAGTPLDVPSRPTIR